MTLTYEQLRDAPGFAVKVYRRGTDTEYFSAWCPFHDDENTPSLMVYRDGAIDSSDKNHHGYWKCLAGCGVGGLDALWRKYNEGGKKRAKKHHKTPMSWKPPFIPSDLVRQQVLVEVAHDMLRKYSDLGWYLKQRGVEGQIIPRFLGYHNGWITIPIFDDAEEYVTVVMRSTPPIEMAGSQRFHCPSDTHVSTLYIPDRGLFRRASKVAVVFGMFDALTLADMMIPVVTPIYGNDSISADQLPKNKKYIIMPDAPEHEYEPAHRLASQILTQKDKSVELVRLPYPEGMKDTNDFFQQGKRKDLEKIMSRWF